MEEKKSINISVFRGHPLILNKHLLSDGREACATSTLSMQDVVGVPGSSPISTTHAQSRDIDTDMEALRMSRQDNPFLQQVVASRQSLDDVEESESDDANLMSQEIYGDIDADPLSLPEVHKHMIRSPPPTSWPKSYNYKMFRYPSIDNQEDLQGISKKKSPGSYKQDAATFEHLHEYGNRGSSSCNVSPRFGLNLGSQQRLNSKVLTDVRRLHTQSCEESQFLVADRSVNP